MTPTSVEPGAPASPSRPPAWVGVHPPKLTISRALVVAGVSLLALALASAMHLADNNGGTITSQSQATLTGAAGATQPGAAPAPGAPAGGAAGTGAAQPGSGGNQGGPTDLVMNQSQLADRLNQNLPSGMSVSAARVTPQGVTVDGQVAILGGLSVPVTAHLAVQNGADGPRVHLTSVELGGLPLPGASQLVGSRLDNLLAQANARSSARLSSVELGAGTLTLHYR